MAGVVERVAKLEERFDGLGQRLDSVDASIARVEIRLEQAVVRLECRLDSGLSDVRTGVRTELGDLRAEMHSQFRWLMGGIGAAILTALAAMASAG